MSARRKGSAEATTAPGRSSSPVETTGTINTAAPTPRFGIEVATATEGDR
ncbi:Uncharacterised protein [Mycobacterium tuberculosis]|uniref:Uncharacterized protein n=1 Tax=Mycobacterium tuberculosis TaxID=1773 RepID=A0A0U0RBC5_MYCTX|nr:Uncharacterised protein [Mycobacterium tuberculosis]COY83732.1 Uncharacterised protein [Mycobacterium tuberculosis]